MARWSSGQDSGLSRRQRGFDSPTSHHIHSKKLNKYTYSTRKCIIYIVGEISQQKVGVDDTEGTPVPIPNTEVKLSSAENTWLVTAWEDRKMPTFEYLHILASECESITKAKCVRENAREC